jgi:two-component system response regulator AtoC
MYPHVLIIDDQEAIRRFLSAALEAQGYRVRGAATAAEGLAAVAAEAPDLVLLDLRLPDRNGLEVLAELRLDHPDLPVVILTSYGRTDAVVEAMRLSALDFVTKPVNLDRLLAVVQRGVAIGGGGAAGRRPEERNDLFAEMPGVIASRAPAMQTVYETVRKVARAGRSTVLVLGESGVGKDVLAQAVHRNSPRADYPFLEINCASLPEQLLESELFGHERGAFTDATQQKLGLLELAHSGTLFLDEIGEMPLPIQVKLLRVLEKMSFRRVGGLEDIAVDVRVVAATNRDLGKLVETGAFREDLYYRLKVVQLVVPPLRQRPEDIPALAEHFVRLYAEEFEREFQGLSPAALAALQERDWPGNVRQLRNTIERSVLLEEGTTLERDQLHFDAETGAMPASDPADVLVRDLTRALRDPLPEAGIDLDGLVGRLERQLIVRALAAATGNQSGASRLLGLGRDRLRYRMKTYDL